MRILYDHQAFTMQRFGGVSRCFCELIAQLPEGCQAEIAVRQSDNVHLLQSHLCDGQLDAGISLNMRQWKKRMPFRGSGRIFNVLRRMGVLKTMESANEALTRERLAKGDFDVFHPTFFDPYFLPLIGNKPWVVTVHDMMPEIFPQYFKPSNEQTTFKRLYLPKAAHIIAVSEKTKEDLMRIMGVADDRITVVYHGGPERELVTAPRMVAEPYFLYVGTRWGYKNFPQTLVDFAEFHKGHGEVKLVCTGGDFPAEERRMMEMLGIADAVEHRSVNDEEMKCLYAHAVAFVYPSQYEGFGMPILEAYAYGCPVLLNNKSCFPEIAADAAVYFDSVEGKSDLAAKLAEVYALSADERQNIINRGYDRLSQFSWKASAAKLAQVYESVVARNSVAGGGNFSALRIRILRRKERVRWLAEKQAA